MGRKRKEEISPEGDNIAINFDDLADDLGASILSKKDSVKHWICTGNLSLNFLCSGKFVGGGIPCGKMIEAYGNSSSCKTLFALNILRGVQKAGGIAVFLDAENTLNKEFAEKAAHVNTDELIVVDTEKIPTMEKAFKMIHRIINKTSDRYGKKKPPIVIVYDSLSASPSEREFADTKVDPESMSKSKIKELGAGVAKPGERAKICSEELRKLNPLLDANNTSVIFINQLRDKIGVYYGNKQSTAGGGRSLEYYSTLRLETRASQRLKDKLENVIGMKVSVSNTKNKVFRPFVSAKDMHLFFDQGINPFGGLLDLLIKQSRIKGTGSGNYVVLEPYANGKEIIFRSNQERNDVPVDALLECPALVDAFDDEKPDVFGRVLTAQEKILSYMDNFGNAQNAVESDVAFEEELSEEESMDV